MKILAIIIVLLMFIVLLIIIAIGQMKNIGIDIKDFMSFIKANEQLETLYAYAKKYDSLTPNEQMLYLDEAKKMFEVFDKIPEAIWEDEHDKYAKVLDAYKNIRVMKWNNGEKHER